MILWKLYSYDNEIIAQISPNLEESSELIVEKKTQQNACIFIIFKQNPNFV